MSDAFSDSYENKILTHFFDLSAPAVSRPSQLYLALFTTGNHPTDSTFGTEISGNNYSRVAVTMSVSGNVASNGSNVVFPTASGTWGTVTHIAFLDDATSTNASNMMAYSQLATSKTINADDVLTFLSGQLTVTLT